VIALTDHVFTDARLALAQEHDIDLYSCAREAIRLCAQRGAVRGMAASLVRLLHADIVETRLIEAARREFVHRAGIVDEPDLYVRTARMNRAMEGWLADFLHARGDLEAAVAIARVWQAPSATPDAGPGV
jgi:hypothetical protein